MSNGHNHDDHENEEPSENELWNLYPSLTGIERIRCLIDIGAYRRIEKDFDNCLAILEQAAEFARTEGFTRELGEILTDLGVVLGDKGEWAGAISLYEQAEPMLASLGDDYQNALLFMAQSHAYRHMDNYDEAMSYQLRAIERFESMGDSISVANGYDDVATLRWRNGQADSAYELRLRSRHFFRGEVPVWRMCSVEIDLVFDAIHVQNYSAALDHAQEALNLAKSCSCDKCVPHAERVYGLALIHAGETALAIEFLERARESFKQLGISTMQAHCLLSLAFAQQTSHPEEARALIAQARSIYTASDSEHHIMRSHMALGLLNLTNENWQCAIDCYNEAIGYFTERRWVPMKNECLTNLSKAYLALNMPAQALGCIEQIDADEKVTETKRIERAIVELSALEMDGKVIKAVDMCEQMLSDIEPGTFPEAEATCHLVLGRALSDTDPIRANHELLRAAAGFTSIGSTDRAQEIMHKCITEPDQRVYQIQKHESSRNQYDDLFHKDPIVDHELDVRESVKEFNHQLGDDQQHSETA